MYYSGFFTETEQIGCVCILFCFCKELRKRPTETESEFYFKELAHVIMGLVSQKSSSQQTEKSGKKLMLPP